MKFKKKTPQTNNTIFLDHQQFTIKLTSALHTTRHGTLEEPLQQQYGCILFRIYTALLQSNNYIKNTCMKHKNLLWLWTAGGGAESRLAQEQLLAAGTLLWNPRLPPHWQLNQEQILTFNRHHLLMPKSCWVSGSPRERSLPLRYEVFAIKMTDRRSAVFTMSFFPPPSISNPRHLKQSNLR